MVDVNKTIFVSNLDGSVTTDIMEMLVTLSSREVSIDDKKRVFDLWKRRYYNIDVMCEFFRGTLFGDGCKYLDVFLETKEYQNFYELAMSLDLANVDSRAYYTFWILNYGRDYYTQLVNDAYDYDSETFETMFPGIKRFLGIEKPTI